MVHNESVNIWSHFLPALIIIIAIISLAFFVDHKQISHDLSSYQKELSSSFDHYIQALDNLTLIEEMK
jgi:predicted membrane channel-forming protein YqfA (hemolysin III family)